VGFIAAVVGVVWLWLELLVLIEWFLNPRPPVSREAYLYQAHPYRAFAPVPNRGGPGHVCSFNSLGLRGSEILTEKSSESIRVLCLGGSTTFSSTATTDSTTYPERMERLLNEHYSAAPFRIEAINAGLPAYTTMESLIYLETCLLDLAPDVVLFHHGLNDAYVMAAFPGYASDFTHARVTFTLPSRRWWEYSPLLSFLHRGQSLANPFFPAHHYSINHLVLIPPHTPPYPHTPELSGVTPEMLATYRRNLVSLVAVARGHGVIPVLSTQVQQNDVYTRWTNEVSRGIAVAGSFALIDFDRAMPWRQVSFSDEIHLYDNERGLGRKARLFAEALIEQRAVERAWARRQGEPLN
jgi:hypothetical protein